MKTVLFAIAIAVAPRVVVAQNVVAQDVVAQEESVEKVEVLEVAEVSDVSEGAEGAASEWHGEGYPVLDRALNLMNGRAMRKGSWMAIIAHRTYAPLHKDPFYNLVGFDGGSLKIGLGVRYGLVDNLDVGVYRMNGTTEPFDTYEFDARYQFLHQSSVGVDMAARLGGSWFSAKGNHVVGSFGQLLASRLFIDRVTVGAGLLFHSDSTGEKKDRSDDKFSAAVSGLVEARLTDWVALDAEVAAGVMGYHEKIPTFSFGPKLITNRHSFAVVLSNTQYMGADGLVANTPRTQKRWVLGFNITREM